jgi:hypothetical protein
MAEQWWHSLRIYYYDSNKDALLLDCIRPLIVTLREHGWAERTYFIRHWQGGSHLRFQVYADPGVFERKIAPYVLREVGGYLRQHPSGGSYTEEDAWREYQERSALSREKLEYVAPVPNNSIHIAPYDSRAAAIGSDGTARLLEDYYVETNDLAFTILDQTRDNYTARLNACLDQLIAVAATCPLLPLTRFIISYRSHSEAYITADLFQEAPAIRRRRLEEAYRERREVVLRRVKLRLEQIEGEQLPNWLAVLVAVHRRYFELAVQGIAAGEVGLKAHFAEGSPDGHLQQSAFHTAIFSNKAIGHYFDTNPVMIAFRIVLNFFYLHLNRIGMRNEDRYILDYYIAEAVEELFNISSFEAIRSFNAVDGKAGSVSLP